jgi:hypothetical protein
MQAALALVLEMSQARWVKLLSARTALHTRLRPADFKAVLDASEGFGAMCEMQGAKLIPTFRTAIQVGRGRAGPVPHPPPQQER